MITYQLPPGIDKFLKFNFLKMEAVLAVIFIIVIVMSYNEMESGTSIIGISLTSIACLYFFGGFFVPRPNDKTLTTIGYNVLHISWSIIIVALMFKILHVPGANSMVMIGSRAAAVALLGVIATSMGNWSSRVTQVIVRSLVLFSLLYFFQ